MPPIKKLKRLTLSIILIIPFENHMYRFGLKNIFRILYFLSLYIVLLYNKLVFKVTS